ncbi:MAG: DUF4826 family protein [Planctomycetaceae bacterium]|nr:DUF4826 family protein [Planctomycetaceae bacterium]
MDTRPLTAEEDIEGEDAEETLELHSMLQEAKAYVASFSWAPEIAEAFMGIGVGGIIGVWLLKFTQPISSEGDDYLWIINGDVPTAYLVTDEAPTPTDALNVYCDLMTDWAEAVQLGRSLEDVFPVEAPADSVHADLLLQRVEFIRTKIIPEFSDD